MKKILLGLAAIIALGAAALAVAVARQPTHTHIERSRVLALPPEALYPYAENLRDFVRWSPWARMDPESEIVFSGEDARGAGAWYTWRSDVVGQGKMTIDAATPPTEVRSTLAFIAPFEATSSAVLHFAPADGGTRVTWSLDQENDLMGRVAGLFIYMDAMLGADFERGFGFLDELATQERAAKEQAAKEKEERDRALLEAASEPVGVPRDLEETP